MSTLAYRLGNDLDLDTVIDLYWDSTLGARTRYQRRGIGRELLRRHHRAGAPAHLILLAAPQAVDYDARAGFTHPPQARVLGPNEPGR